MVENHNNQIKNYYDDEHFLAIATDTDVPFRHLGYFADLSEEIDFVTAQENYIKEMAKYIKEGSTVLDIGCGLGGTAIWLVKNLNCHVYGIDLVESQIEKAKAVINNLNLGDQIELHCMDAGDMEFEADKFDYVIALNTLYHVPERGKIFDKIFKMLKKGGGFALADLVIGAKCSWFSRKFADFTGGGIAFFSQVEEYLKLLKESGFEIVADKDVTQNTTLNSLEYSKREKYETLCRFMGKKNNFIMRSAFNMLGMAMKPGLRKKHWGEHIFWTQKPG